MKNIFKQLFASIGEDIKELFKKHWLKLVGLIICFFVPVGVLLTFYVQKVDNGTKYTIPFAVMIPLIVLLLVYWFKAKVFFAQKLQAMKVQNSLQAGKHAGLIVLFELIRSLMTILPFALCYLLINELQKFYANVSSIFLFIMICETIGLFFCLLDTIKNVTGVEQKEESNE